MVIKYTGHACFKVRDNETGYSIVFDPYQPDSVRGFGKIVDTASKVLCSHDHFDHNSAESVQIEPNNADPYEIQVIDTFHDDRKGALRGRNRIHIITDKRTGERLIHYGDIGEVLDDLLTEENCKLLLNADYALIPVGGTYTYDADEALELIRRTSPKVAIPMHFKSDTWNFGLEQIGSIESFMEKAGRQGFNMTVGKVSFYDTEANDLRDCILVLKPQNAYVPQ